jgi:hypothetical protein
VAWQLTEAGYTVELDVWDWAAGRNFVTAISDALERAATCPDNFRTGLPRLVSHSGGPPGPPASPHFALLVNFASLATPFSSDLPGMWMRQLCYVEYASTQSSGI